MSSIEVSKPAQMYSTNTLLLGACQLLWPLLKLSQLCKCQFLNFFFTLALVDQRNLQLVVSYLHNFQMGELFKAVQIKVKHEWGTNWFELPIKLEISLRDTWVLRSHFSQRQSHFGSCWRFIKVQENRLVPLPTGGGWYSFVSILPLNRDVIYCVHFKQARCIEISPWQPLKIHQSPSKTGLCVHLPFCPLYESIESMPLVAMMKRSVFLKLVVDQVRSVWHSSNVIKSFNKSAKVWYKFVNLRKLVFAEQIFDWIHPVLRRPFKERVNTHSLVPLQNQRLGLYSVLLLPLTDFLWSITVVF